MTAARLPCTCATISIGSNCLRIRTFSIGLMGINLPCVHAATCAERPMEERPMKCPVCKDVTLLMSEKNGVEIDYCPECRGIWLDRASSTRLSIAPATRATGIARASGRSIVAKSGVTTGTKVATMPATTSVPATTRRARRSRARFLLWATSWRFSAANRSCAERDGRRGSRVPCAPRARRYTLSDCR